MRGMSPRFCAWPPSLASSRSRTSSPRVPTLPREHRSARSPLGTNGPANKSVARGHRASRRRRRLVHLGRFLAKCRSGQHASRLRYRFARRWRIATLGCGHQARHRSAIWRRVLPRAAIGKNAGSAPTGTGAQRGTSTLIPTSLVGIRRTRYTRTSHGRSLPRLHPRALSAAPQLRCRRGRGCLVRGGQPPVRRPDHADARRQGRHRGPRRVHRPRLRHLAGQREPPDRRDQGQAARPRSPPSAPTTCSTCSASTSARPG